MTDEEYAEQLSLQEALMSCVSLSDTNSSSHPHYRKSEIGESSSSTLKPEDTSKNTESNSGNNSGKKMKSSTEVNAGLGDDQYYSSETSLCQICIEAKPANEMRNSTYWCAHVYCSECIAKHVAAKIQENITQITCPEFNCKETLEPHLCRGMIPCQVFDRWANALCKSSILASHKIYCPFKDCSALLVHDDDEWMIIRETECPHCRRLFCAKCKVPWHSDMDCNEYQELKKGGGLEDAMLVKLAANNKWRRCPSCSYYVEKKDGCVHITCRCKYEFCYICGVKWHPYRLCFKFKFYCNPMINAGARRACHHVISSLVDPLNF